MGSFKLRKEELFLHVFYLRDNLFSKSDKGQITLYVDIMIKGLVMDFSCFYGLRRHNIELNPLTIYDCFQGNTNMQL